MNHILEESAKETVGGTCAKMPVFGLLKRNGKAYTGIVKVVSDRQ